MAIEQVAPELDRIVSQDQEIEELGKGYSIAEGPLWHAGGGYLLFSNIRDNLRLKWKEGEGITVDGENTNQANGLTWDAQGRLVICEGGARRMTRREADGSITVVADNYEGVKLNHPNDVVVKSDGSIYFSDPGVSDPELDMDFRRGFTEFLRTLAPLICWCEIVSCPTVCASLRTRASFTSTTPWVFPPTKTNMFRSVGNIRAFDVQPDGTLTNDRVLLRVKGGPVRPSPMG